MAYDPTIPALNNYISDDIPKIMANFAELAGSRIVEMGSNANGEYVRWENGLQICFGWVVAFTGDDTPNPQSGTHTLPAEFASNAAIWAGAKSDIWDIYHDNRAINAVRASFPWSAERQTGGWGSTVSYRIHFIAIGRWK